MCKLILFFSGSRVNVRHSIQKMIKDACDKYYSTLQESSTGNESSEISGTVETKPEEASTSFFVEKTLSVFCPQSFCS